MGVLGVELASDGQDSQGLCLWRVWPAGGEGAGGLRGA